MKLYWFTIPIILIVSIIMFLGGCGVDSANEANLIDGEGLDKKIEQYTNDDNFTLLDVRTMDEYNTGHLRYAVNLPLDAITNNLSRIEDLKDSAVFVICRSGNRSTQAQNILIKNDFTNVINAIGMAMYDYKMVTTIPFLRGREFTELVVSGKYPVIDARSPEEFNEKHMKSAINIPLTIDLLADTKNLEQIMSEKNIDKQIPILVYGANREDAYQLINAMFGIGYIGVSAIDGIDEFTNYPVE